jgi:hypothetical protein
MGNLLKFMLPAGGRMANCRGALGKGALWPLAAPKIADTLGL